LLNFAWLSFIHILNLIFSYLIWHTFVIDCSICFLISFLFIIFSILHRTSMYIWHMLISSNFDLSYVFIMATYMAMTTGSDLEINFIKDILLFTDTPSTAHKFWNKSRKVQAHALSEGLKLGTPYSTTKRLIDRVTFSSLLWNIFFIII